MPKDIYIFLEPPLFDVISLLEITSKKLGEVRAIRGEDQEYLSIIGKAPGKKREKRSKTAQ